MYPYHHGRHLFNQLKANTQAIWRGEELPEEKQKDKLYGHCIMFFETMTESLMQLSLNSVIIREFGLSPNVYECSNQISGLVSNIKGIYHELEFVNFENEDGDSVFAVMHESTNYPGTDVVLFDTTTGESLEVQLKAVADDQAIDRWVEENPGIAVYATEEVAEDSGVKSSGMKNDELQKDVEDFVDQVRNAEDPLTVVDQLPSLALASVGFAVYLLYRDYNKGLISLGDFKVKAAAVTGIKAAKMGMFVCLLSLPVIGQITGAALIIKLLLSLDLSCFDRSVIRRS